MAYSRSYNYRLHVRYHDVFGNAKTTTPLWTVLSHYANMLKAKTIIRKNQKIHTTYKTCELQHYRENRMQVT